MPTHISGAELQRQYKHAKEVAGNVIDRIEQEFGILDYLMYAIGSRETNFSDFWLTHPGDEGHGHGWWQIDNRSHEIPDDWSTNIDWQCRRGAEILVANFQRCGTWEQACNAYNSGRCNGPTTPPPYGPDVMERQRFLFDWLGPRRRVDPWDDLFVPVLAG